MKLVERTHTQNIYIYIYIYILFSFTTVFSYSASLLKKNGDLVLLLQSLYLVGLFFILTMTTSVLGSSSCYTKIKL